ncbi:MAG: hypothetical protein ILP07_12755 [Treponema sp.]|nr:hypothetical protein [Treponema sp.]
MRIQSSFTDRSDFLIRKAFNIGDDEFLICGIWTGLKRTGFVFTDHGLYWNMATELEKDGKKSEVTLPAKILQRNVTDIQSEILYKKEEQSASLYIDDSARKPEYLQLTTSIGKIRISINSLDYNESRILRRIFIDYAARGNFPYEYLSQTPLDSLTFTAEAFLDFFASIPKGYKKPKNEKESEEENEEREYFSSNGEIQDINSYFSSRTKNRATPEEIYRNAVRYALDIISGLFLWAAIIIGLKPMLLFKSAGKAANAFSNFFANIGSLLLKFDSVTREKVIAMDWQGNHVDSIMYRRNYIFALLLFIYLALKIFVIFTCAKGTKKALPLGLLALSVPLLLLVPNHFFIYVVLSLGIYILMQLSLGLEWFSVGFKIIVSLVAMFLLYYLLHLFGYPEFINYMGVIMKMLDLNAPWF